MDYVICFAGILSVPFILERKNIARYYSYNNKMARKYGRLALRAERKYFRGNKKLHRKAANHYKKMQGYYRMEAYNERRAI